MRNMNISGFRNQFMSPQRKLTTHHIRDLVMPAPILTPEKIKTKNIFKNTVTKTRASKKKKNNYFKKGFRSQVRLHKNWKENNLI